MTTPLQKAAQALIERWDSPAWKDQPHTAEYIAELRKALDAEIAQAVEPVAWGMRRPVTPLVLDIICPEEHARHEGEYTKPLYLHPPQPQATTAVPDGYVLVPIEPTPAMWSAVNKLDDEVAANYDGRGCSIEQAWECLLAAAQREKP